MIIANPPYIKEYENKSVFYSIKDKTLFKNKKICIFGGGDSALDWAIELSKFAEVILIHRRKEFRGVEHSAAIARKLEKEGKLKISIGSIGDDIAGVLERQGVKLS